MKMMLLYILYFPILMSVKMQRFCLLSTNYRNSWVLPDYVAEVDKSEPEDPVPVLAVVGDEAVGHHDPGQVAACYILRHHCSPNPYPPAAT
jgi:hypothetical protein